MAFRSVHSGLLSLLLVLVQQENGGCARTWFYEHQRGEKVYYAVEEKRILRLLEIRLRETSSPFNPWDSVLVEPCSADEAELVEPAGARNPCWPRENVEPTQEFLASLISELPEYRDMSSLLKAAGYINRGIGAFHPAWVVGTYPLTVAYRQGTADPAPYSELALKHGTTTRPATTPGVVEIITRSGRTTLYDRRSRRVELVSDDALDIKADVVLMFPREMHLPSGQMRPASTTQPAPKAQIFYLREPMSLRSIMRAMAEDVALERHAERVEEVEVESR